MLTQINTLLTKLSITYRDVTEKKLKAIGIHSGQAQVLSILWQTDGITQADLCRKLNVSSPTVNLLVNKIKNKKFVKCQKCPTDKRIQRIYLTDKGRKIRPKIEAQWLEIEEILLLDFSDTEKLLVMMLLEKMTKNIKTNLLGKN